MLKLFKEEEETENVREEVIRKEMRRSSGSESFESEIESERS